MNRYDEVTGKPLRGESPQKNFGEPLPGDPSLMYTIQHNRLANLEKEFNKNFTLDAGTKVQTGKFISADAPANLEAFVHYSNRSGSQANEPDIHTRAGGAIENVFQTLK